MAPPLAYFITFTTYGAWLHGRNPGSVDRMHNQPGEPWVTPNAGLEQTRRHELRDEAYALDDARRQVVLHTLCAVATHRGWCVWAAHVRSNHVHVIVTADAPPEKVMSDFKAWASRRLREGFAESTQRQRWTEHGSTRYLNDPASLQAAVAYVLEGQGEQMAVYDGRFTSNPPNTSIDEPEA